MFTEHYLTGIHSMPIGENYLISVTPLDAAARVSYSDGKLSVSNGIRTQTDIQYYDGLGRPVQTIALGQTPTSSDLVTRTQYTGLKRHTRTWLPVVSETQGQSMDDTEFISLCQSLYADVRPYTETVYENTALNRISAVKRPGRTWERHPKTYQYNINTTGENICKYTVLNGGLLGGSLGDKLKYEGNYASGTLYKNTISDEDGISVTTYTDKLNRTIMENRNGHNTYYVYDELDRLRLVLPPACSQQITVGTHDMETDAILKQLAYCYQYDASGNMIYKRLPGCEPQYMVYDEVGQLVLKQDGNQRATNKWMMYAYDSIGRSVYSSEITMPQNLTHADLIAFYADKWQVEHFAKTSQPNAVGNTGYASTLMENVTAKVLTVNYYDSYDFLDKLSNTVKRELKYEFRNGYDYQHDNATGLLTGTRTYNISNNSYIVTAYYYDYKGRIIQQRGTTHSGGYEKKWFRFNFDSTIAELLTEQNIAEDVISEKYSYTYDHAGRVQTVKYQHNNLSEITLNNYLYDSLGHLARNLKGDNDTIFYGYDMRGALIDIQSNTFSEHLFYADDLENGMTACYNGNIAAAYISHPDSVYKFAYTYDLQNRLLTSKILMPAGSSLSSEEFTYNGEGNIQTLKRYNGSKLIDDLIYQYKSQSNKLASICDYAGSLDLSSVKEYNDNHSSLIEDDMEYDANGNMISDRDRGIYLIKYNQLNLPDTVQFTDGNQIVNLYDAAGVRYKTIYYTLLPIAATPEYQIAHYSFDSDTVTYNVTEYMGSIEKHFNRDSTWFCIYNPEGYLVNDTLYCYYRDHLGNNVAVRNMLSDSIVQRTVYYASGLPMAQSFGEGTQPYKYNGKEFMEIHGLNETDMGHRYLYHAISRFSTIDRFSELYPWQSPYIFASNNPVNYLDINGDSIYVEEQDREDMNNILTELFDQYAEDFDYTESGFLIYKGNSDELPEEQNEILSELLEYIQTPYETITGIIFQNRTEEGKDYTISDLQTIGRQNIRGYILEPPGPSTIEENQDKRIPEGVYAIDCHNGVRYSGTYVLYNRKVPKYRGILYHGGNIPSDTKGCQIPGTTKGDGFVNQSQNKLREIKWFISTHGIKSTITIINRRKKQ